MYGGVMVCFFCFIIIFRSAKKNFPVFADVTRAEGWDVWFGRIWCCSCEDLRVWCRLVADGGGSRRLMSFGAVR